MEISITNFRNIEQLGISIDEGKVNYLFGICGSGKTSILDAIRKKPNPEDTRVGSGADNPSIIIDGNLPSYSSTRIYSLEQQEILFSEDPSSDCYHIFIGDESELITLEESFNSSIDNLRKIRDELIIFKGKVDQLGKTIGRPTKTGYTARSKLGKAQSAMSRATRNPESVVKSGDITYVEWRSKGFEISDSFGIGVCPFCGQIIPEDTLRSLEELRALSSKDLKPALQATTLLSELGLQEPDYADEEEFERLKRDLQDLFRAYESVSAIIDYTYIGRGTTLLEGMPSELDVDPIVYRFFPELEALVLDVKARRDNLMAQIGKMRGVLQKLVSSNSRRINSQLKMLGIPYEFTVDSTDREHHTASYVLRHMDSDTGTDMRKCLSYGERNLVALILFLHGDNASLTLIDDPASSYDDFRRSQIYDCIMRHKGKTVLVVSHDQAFVRRAVCDQDRSRLGRVLFLENRADGCTVTELTRDSFVFIDDEIRSRIAGASTYYQKLINARLYCDIHKEDVGNTIWGYTSAILHGGDRASVTELLSERGVTESDILTNFKQSSDIDLDPMPPIIDRTVNDDFTDYEVLVHVREVLSRKKDNGTSLTPDEVLQHDMLNDLVHMNDCALFCLNPYRYATWPSTLSDTIEYYRTTVL